MEKKELLTIAEFAAAIQQTKQAVYKQLNNKLKDFVVIVDDKKFIKIQALEQYENQQVEQQLNKKSQQVEQQLNNQILTLLESQIEEKDRQIETLFNQLEQKDKQIETLQNLLSQSQHLQAANTQLLLEKDNKKKQGFFGIFKKKEKEEN
jgi:hypothetical protein